MMLDTIQGTLLKEWNTLPFSEEQLKTVFLAHLREMQKNQGARLFGECRFCRFHQQQNGRLWCGLTGEPIPAESVTLICREFEAPGKSELINER